MSREITFALTSCGRLDLLERTIRSFMRHNTMSIARWVMTEDSGKPEVYEHLLKAYPWFEIKFNEHRLGPIGSLFRLYEDIETPWIFHSEDDWEFIESGFMEKSFDVLEREENVLQVWLRADNDTNGHVVLPEVYKAGETEYRLVHPSWGGVWCGFSTNPGLRQTSDQQLIDKSATMEEHISRQFLAIGRRAAILSKRYVVHIGAGLSAFFGQYPGLNAT